MSKFMSKEIADIYTELLKQFSEYKNNNKEFVFTSYVNSNIVQLSNNSKWCLLNEINKNSQTYFNNYHFSCICVLDALEFVDWHYKKVPENEDNFNEFGKEGEGCFVLKMKIKNIISMKYNFWPYTNIKKNAYINILIYYKDVSYYTDYGGNIYDVNFDKTFLDFCVDNNNEIIVGNDSTNMYVYSYENSKEDTRISLINTDLLDITEVHNYLNKDYYDNTILDINMAKNIINKMLEEERIDELMELEKLLVSILHK